MTTTTIIKNYNCYNGSKNQTTLKVTITISFIKVIKAIIDNKYYNDLIS